MSSESQELEPLCQALALVEGFQLLILECADLDPEGLQRILDSVLVRVAQLRGARPLLFRYDPYQTTEDEGALRDEAWVEGVLQPILELPRPTDETGSVIAVIDGTRAAVSDGSELPSWLFLFHRVNERRNAIARVFAGTLAFALPPLLVRMFLEEAPDAASIRSGQFRLHAGLVPGVKGTAPPAASRPVRRHRGDIDAHDSPESALKNLLLSLFSTDELRRFVAMMPDGVALNLELPGESAPSDYLAFSVINLLNRHGLLPEFLERLLAHYPLWRPLIEATAIRLPLPARRGTFRSDDAAAGSPSRSQPITTVLMVSANADPTWRLQMDREFRTIISRSRHVRLSMIYVRAGRAGELREVISTQAPTILHLHADVDSGGNLVFSRGSDASFEKHSIRAFLKLLGLISDKIKVVVVEGFNAINLTQEISSVIGYAIAVDVAAPDTLRIDFFVAFYEALAYGRSIEKAFVIGLGGIKYDQNDAFRLFIAANKLMGRPSLPMGPERT